ncbi:MULTISPECIES: hypothetical protein [Clostridium]|uniref:hypothetical protein n=1 Tax=Clostridium TaxID=1485 RepID=UPI000C06E393|nr:MULTISPECIES: hypothetical protein [Clostridium]MDB2086463.1 hypothetical protein [Clostridium paraputrificum]MDU2108622.1 hypothetical protein [Clostridium sp.]MDU3354836.1 hypothetical protein [Clostridium sp.]DAL22416.1 MAG TPA_asm: nucleocapsid protein [Caudoviricetes sp.]
MEKKEQILLTLKGRFNYWLIRRINAEHYFETHPDEVNKKYLHQFDLITQKLSETQRILEAVLERKLTEREITTGLKI